jgi:hypothetical protein
MSFDSKVFHEKRHLTQNSLGKKLLDQTSLDLKPLDQKSLDQKSFDKIVNAQKVV